MSFLFYAISLLRLPQYDLRRMGDVPYVLFTAIIHRLFMAVQWPAHTINIRSLTD
jgi:hypothetical protein